MNNELLLLIEKHFDTVIDQPKTKPQETFEFKMKQLIQTFSFNLQNSLSEEGKWLLAVAIFNATEYVFNIIDENNSFSMATPNQWSRERSGEFNNKLNNLLELRSQNYNELHVKEVEKRGTRIEIENSG